MSVVDGSTALYLIGSAVWGGFSNTSEPKVMNFKEAMKSTVAKSGNEGIKNEKKN